MITKDVTPEKKGYYFLKDNPNLKKAIMLTANARSVAARKYVSHGINILPGISSNDPRVLRLLVELSNDLNAKLPIKHSPDGLCRVGALDADFGILSCAAGFIGTPGGYVQRDLTRRNLALGITTPDGFLNSRHEAIFDKLIYCMCSEVLAGDLKVASKSSQGLPFCHYDKDQKVADAVALLRRAPEFLDAISSLDGSSILEKYNVLPVYVQNFRKSPDKPGKVRWVAPLDFTLGVTNELLEMDKSVYLNNQLIDGVSACRPRHVMGMNNPINILISTWRNGVSRFYGNKYSYTWKHQGKVDLEDKLNKGWTEIHGVDVSQFDNSVKRWHLEAIINSCLKQGLFTEEFGNLLRRTFFAPVFQTESGDGNGPLFIGNPLTKDQLESPGLLSGHDLVSFVGKVLNTFNILVGFDQYLDVLNNIDDILSGSAPLGLLNAGDDCLILINKNNLKESNDEIFKEILNKSTYFIVEEEKPISFLGYSIWTDDKNYKVHHNLVSFYKNTLVPERGYDSKLREYWFVGLAAKFSVFRETPYFRESLDIIDELWANSNITGYTYTAFIEYLIDRNKNNIPIYNDLSQRDAEFLANPNVIHYKYDVDDIDPELVNEVFGSIPVSLYVDDMNPYFNNRINTNWR